MCKIQLEFNTEAELEAYLNGYELAKKIFKKPHGKWLWSTNNNNVPYCKCSVCGIGMGDAEFDFCPNCGADMRKKRGDTE